MTEETVKPQEVAKPLELSATQASVVVEGTHTVAATKFSFRTDKDTKVKRPTLELLIPYLSATGVIEALSQGDEKIMQYVTDVLNQEIYLAVRSQLDDDSAPVCDQEHLDFSKLSLTFLANMPKAERSGGGISKETWDAFKQDYTDTALAMGKDPSRVELAAKFFATKFAPVKTNKQVLAKLKELLAEWAQTSTNVETFSACYEFLLQKVDTLLQADEAVLLEAL